MASQRSYATLNQRFKNGNTLIQPWADYAPGNALIKKPALVTFVADVDAANDLVDTTENDLGIARGVRTPLVYQVKDTNPACLEMRMRGIESYLRSDPDNNAFLTASKKVKAILLKIRPKYAKKDPANPAAKTKSPMEKSFASAVGYGRNVITIATSLGVAYSPADANLSVAGMTTLVDLIETENGNVQLALEAYGEANKARSVIYKGATGMEKRTRAILNYLASFSGLKKSNHYREFNQAIKGT